MSTLHTNEPMQGLAFRKRPVVIQAVRVQRRMDILSPEWFYAAVESNIVLLHNMGKWSTGDAHCCIKTLEGTMRADEGDWIIRGVKGELYPCKPDIFAATYEPAEVESLAAQAKAPASVQDTAPTAEAAQRALLAQFGTDYTSDREIGLAAGCCQVCFGYRECIEGMQCKLNLSTLPFVRAALAAPKDTP